VAIDIVGLERRRYLERQAPQETPQPTEQPIFGPRQATIDTFKDQKLSARPDIDNAMAELSFGREAIGPPTKSASDARALYDRENTLPPITWLDEMKRVTDRPDKLLSFVGAGVEAVELGRLAISTNRLIAGEDIEEDDLQRLQEYITRSSRDMTWGAQVMSGINQLVPFMGEILLTAGIYTGGAVATRAAIKAGRVSLKKLLTTAGKKALAEAVEKLAQRGTVRVGEKIVAGVAGGTARWAVTGVTHIPRGAIEKQLQAKITGNEESVMESIVKAAGEHWVDIVSEQSGGLFTQMAKPLKGRLAKNAIFIALQKANPLKTSKQVQQLLNRAGYSGIFGEMMEERVADLGHGLLEKAGMGDQELKLPSWNDLSVELAVLMTPAAGGAVLSSADNKLRSNAAEANARKVLKIKTEGEIAIEEIDKAYDKASKSARDEAAQRLADAAKVILTQKAEQQANLKAEYEKGEALPDDIQERVKEVIQPTVKEQAVKAEQPEPEAKKPTPKPTELDPTKFKTAEESFNKYTGIDHIDNTIGLDRRGNWRGGLNVKTGKPYTSLKEYMKVNKGAEGKLVSMTPDEYIQRVSEGGGRKADVTEKLDAKFYVDKIKAGDKLDAPYIQYTKNGINQEGLHRALAAKQSGIKEIPVIVATTDNIPLSKHLTKSQLTDIYNKAKEAKPKAEVKPIKKPVKEAPKKVVKEVVAKKPTEKVKVPSTQVPVGKGETKVSRLEERMKQALGNVTEEDRANLSTFDTMNKQANIERAVDWVSKNPEKAIQVLRGDINPPEGMLKNAVFIAMNELAIGDSDLATKLASQAATRAGQEISILTEISPNSPVKWITKLQKRRIEVVGGLEIVKKARTTETKKLKQSIKKNAPKKNEWDSFLDEISC